VCDGALPIFRNKPLLVVGGGDSACEEAAFLSTYASSVTMLVRRDVFRASRAMRRRVLSNSKIRVMWNTVPLEALGEATLSGVRVRDVKSGEERVIEASGLFYAVGHEPNTSFLGRSLETDETGYILTKPGSTRTSVPGVFACGDVQDRVYRQAVTAAGSGCMAALEAVRYLEDLEAGGSS
jgi:thioredoxin reductase (NADPH)